MNKPILILDFDGVIHQYNSGWKGAHIVTDEPVPGAVDAINAYLEHFKVAIYSARTTQDGGIQAMKNWMIKYGFPVDQLEFPTNKPPAFLTIDDRAICFKGHFPDAENLLEFKPWNKSDV